MSVDEFRQHCNGWYGDFLIPQCGDWEQVSPLLGTSVSAVERVASDTSAAWMALANGRVYVSRNVDAEPASAVAWTRIDSATVSSPARFVTGIHVDPANPNRAWISFSGFGANTPYAPGHVYQVVFNPATSAASWTDVSYNLGDLPINDVARDDTTGDLYASSDFNVMRLPAGGSSWVLAAPGLPQVEVSGLTIVPGARKLYAATHGLGAWLLNLP